MCSSLSHDMLEHKDNHYRYFQIILAYSLNIYPFFNNLQYRRPLKKGRYCDCQSWIREHSTTTWTEFCHFLTPLPSLDSFHTLRQTFLIPSPPPQLVYVVFECPLRPKEFISIITSNKYVLGLVCMKLKLTLLVCASNLKGEKCTCVE